MKYIVILLTFSFIMGSTSCDLFNWKENQTTELEKLPPVTQTGENTFGYLVNGEAVVVNNTAKITAIFQKGLLQLGGGVENGKKDIDIDIKMVDPIFELVNYDLTQTQEYRSRFRDFKKLNDCDYDYDDTYDGEIIFLRIDRNKFILSGKFSFSTALEGCDTIHITDGRFDIKYIP